MLPILSMPGHLIRRAHQLSSGMFAERVAQAGYDVTQVQFGALTAIKTFPGLDQASLAEMIAYDRVTIGGVLDRLQAKGYIERSISTTDRRARVLTLTDQGLMVLTALLPVVEAVQTDIIAELSINEQKTLMALLQKIMKIQTNNAIEPNPHNNPATGKRAHELTS